MDELWSVGFSRNPTQDRMHDGASPAAHHNYHVPRT
jgi:hypothetical protein